MDTYDYIGFHTKIILKGKDKTKNLPNVKSLQVFIQSPKKIFDSSIDGKVPIYKDLIERWKKHDSERKIFLHASYTINLSNSEDYSVKSLIIQIRAGKEIGADGIVIHCPKYLKDSKDKAVKRFYENVDKLMSEVTDDCPLIIETCVGAGTELFSRLSDFDNMIITLAKRYGRKIGSCIDTAHVWSSSYHPKDFLNRLSGECRGTIRVVHWNNSTFARGSCRDCHAPIDDGLIDECELWEIAFWAISHKIPLVIE